MISHLITRSLDPSSTSSFSLAEVLIRAPLRFAEVRQAHYRIRMPFFQVLSISHQAFERICIIFEWTSSKLWVTKNLGKQNLSQYTQIEAANQEKDRRQKVCLILLQQERVARIGASPALTRSGVAHPLAPSSRRLPGQMRKGRTYVPSSYSCTEPEQDP